MISNFKNLAIARLLGQNGLSPSEDLDRLQDLFHTYLGPLEKRSMSVRIWMPPARLIRYKWFEVWWESYVAKKIEVTILTRHRTLANNPPKRLN